MPSLVHTYLVTEALVFSVVASANCMRDPPGEVKYARPGSLLMLTLLVQPVGHPNGLSTAGAIGAPMGGVTVVGSDAVGGGGGCARRGRKAAAVGSASSRCPLGFRVGFGFNG